MAVLEIILEGKDLASGVIDGVDGALDGLAGLASGALTAGFAAAAAGAAGLAAGLGVCLSAAMDNEKIQANLAQVIKSTGGAAGVTAEYANELAGQFKGLAGGSDDAILAIETIGLRAGTVSAEQMPAFIQSTLDLGAVMGDTSAAAQLLARAQDDPLAAFKRIERATGAYDSALEDQIKQLQDAGDTAGATALIMGKLADTTGGAAAAQADTLSGQWEIFKGTLGEAAETIGMSLLPVARDLFDSVIKPAIPIIEALASTVGGMLSEAFGLFSDNINDTRGIMFGLRDAIATSLGVFMDEETANGIADFAQGIAVALKSVVDWVVANWPQIQATITDVFTQVQAIVQAVIDAVVPFILEMWGKVSAWFIENMPLIQQTIKTVLDAIQKFWAENGAAILGDIQAVWGTISGLISGALDVILGYIKAGMQVINGDWAGANKTMEEVWAKTWDGISAWFSTAIQNIGKAVSSIDWGGIGKSIIDGIGNGIRGAAQSLANAAAQAANDALNAAKNALGIHSPSAAFMTVGVNMMAGMAQGIAAGSGQVAGAMDSAARGVVNNTYNSFAVTNYGSSPEENTLQLRALAIAGAW